jgi:5-methyltetrahydrofolate--homocysteine methyltransferase
MIDFTKRLIFDGSMGTMLLAKGLPPNQPPEIWNITQPNTIREIHESYINASCDIIKTNTFGANRLKLAGSGYGVGETVKAGVLIAKKITDSEKMVALSVGPTGRLLAPFGDLDFEEAVAVFAETIKAGAEAGADVILIETMSDTYEIKAAMLAAKETCGLPLMVTFTANERGRLLTGGDIQSAVCLIEGLGAAALGLNCGFGADKMKSLIPQLVKYSGIPIIINPNAGLPELIDGKTTFRMSPSDFAAEMAEISPSVQLIGGCCGTTPEHISQMVNLCRDIPFTPAKKKDCTAVTSYGQTVVFSDKTVVIGERINPTNKPDMIKALVDGDMDFIIDEGLSQIEEGAEILDVNVGTPEIDEAKVMATAIYELQSITKVPLQIDTCSCAAAERALRLYNGKPLLNSVNGTAESLKNILPIVKKYGASVVALAFDEKGIPKTAQGRIDVLKNIINEAAKYGMPKCDIIADALVLPAITGTENAEITLETMRKIRDELGLRTVLGISNISFGMPNREAQNAEFTVQAVKNGLSAAIVNPGQSKVMEALAHND